MLWATLILSLAVTHIAAEGDEHVAYRRCLRQASIYDPAETDLPTVVAFAKYVQSCSNERKLLLDKLIEQHVAIDDLYGKAKAYRDLEGFELDMARLYSNRAHELPIADERGIF